MSQLEVSLGVNEEHGKRLDQELKESARLSSLFEEAKIVIADLQAECGVHRTEADGQATASRRSEPPPSWPHLRLGPRKKASGFHGDARGEHALSLPRSSSPSRRT